MASYRMDASSVSSRHVKWSCGGQEEVRHGAGTDRRALRTYLVQLEAHSDGGSHHLLQQVQVSKHPLVFGGDAEVALEQGVEPVQKRLQTGNGRKEKALPPPVGDSETLQVTFEMTALIFSGSCNRDIMEENFKVQESSRPP